MRTYKNRGRGGAIVARASFVCYVMILLFTAAAARADLVFDSGYNTFDANDPYYDEVWVINDAHLDVLGGAIWKLELTDYATANIYDGDIKWLFIRDSTVTNIIAAGDTLEMFAGGNESLAYLYAYDVIYYPTGGLAGEGWIEGRYYSNDTPFSFSFYSNTSYSHLIVLPRPIAAEVHIQPHTLNVQSCGKWVTCHIYLPEDYNVADVNSYSILLENQISADWLWFNEAQNVLMAKFSRTALLEILEQGEVELTVSGSFENGTYFQGSDTIRVIDKGHKEK